MAGPAYTRVEVDERRRRLLALGAELFARFSYDELQLERSVDAFLAGDLSRQRLRALLLAALGGATGRPAGR